MLHTLLIAYATIAAAAAVVVFVASARLGDEPRPHGQRMGLSLAAGVVWPVILLGLAELSSFAMYAKVHEHDDDEERVLVVV
jgi:ABC-type spermidine/putrescine transport system permease subunit II